MERKDQPGARGRSGAFTRAFVWTLVALAAASLVARVVGAVVPSWGTSLPEITVELAPGRLGAVLGVPMTNTLLSAWLSSVLIVAVMLLARVGSGPFSRVLRNARDLLLEAILNFTTEMVGPTLARKLLPVAATFFLFIMANAWVSILPVYGPLVATRGDGSEFPLLRGAGTDINMTLSVAIIAGVAVEGLGIAAHRTNYFRRFFRVRGLLRGHLVEGTVDLIGGLLEGLAQLTRVLSFTFRLLGNMTAGELLIIVAAFLVPLVLPTALYIVEMAVAAIQAWIFVSLMVIFASEAVGSREGDRLETRDAR